MTVPAVALLRARAAEIDAMRRRFGGRRRFLALALLRIQPARGSVGFAGVASRGGITLVPPAPRLVVPIVAYNVVQMRKDA